MRIGRRVLNIKALRELARRNDAARELFEWLAGLGEHAEETTVDRMCQNTGRERWEIIQVLRQLDDLGFGRFIVGRKGHDSRFQWSVHRRELGEAALGDRRVLKALEDQESDSLPNAAEVEEWKTLAETMLMKGLKLPRSAITIIIEP